MRMWYMCLAARGRVGKNRLHSAYCFLHTACLWFTISLHFILYCVSLPGNKLLRVKWKTLKRSEHQKVARKNVYIWASAHIDFGHPEPFWWIPTSQGTSLIIYVYVYIYIYKYIHILFTTVGSPHHVIHDSTISAFKTLPFQRQGLRWNESAIGDRMWEDVLWTGKWLFQGVGD